MLLIQEHKGHYFTKKKYFLKHVIDHKRKITYNSWKFVEKTFLFILNKGLLCLFIKHVFSSIRTKDQQYKETNYENTKLSQNS